MTGFEPFGADSENASGQAVQLLADGWDSDCAELATGILPVSFSRAGPYLEQLLSLHAPDAVLAVGEAGGRTAFTPERVAVNTDDARIPDNDGAQPRAEPVIAGAETLRLSGLDPDAQVAALRAASLPALVSEDAGRFLCNHVAYLVSGLDVPGGFVHVPAVRAHGPATVGAETDAAPADGVTALVLSDLVRGLEVLVLELAGRLSAGQSRSRGTLGPSSAGSR